MIDLRGISTNWFKNQLCPSIRLSRLRAWYGTTSKSLSLLWYRISTNTALGNFFFFTWPSFSVRCRAGSRSGMVWRQHCVSWTCRGYEKSPILKGLFLPVSCCTLKAFVKLYFCGCSSGLQQSHGVPFKDVRKSKQQNLSSLGFSFNYRNTLFSTYRSFNSWLIEHLHFVHCSVPDPWHFGTDPRLHTSD